MSVSLVGTNTLVAPAGAASYAVPTPTGSAAGDILVVIAMSLGSVTVAPPSDGTWTTSTSYASGTGSTVPRATSFWKTLTGVAASTYTFTPATTTAIGGFVTFIFRTTQGVWDVTVNGTNNLTISPYAAPSVSLIGDGYAVFTASSVGNAGYTVVPPASPFVEVVNRVASGTIKPYFSVGYKTYVGPSTAGPESFSTAINTTFSPMTVGVSVLAGGAVVAKQTGMGDRLFVGGYDLSGDVGSVSGMGGGPAPLDVTGISSSAFERLGGLRSGQLSFMSYFNDAAGQEHPVLSPQLNTDVQISYFHGATIGNSAASMVSKQTNYDPTRGADGSLTLNINAVSNKYGLEWGNMLTAGIRTDTAATNGASYDGAAATAFGLQAYLHLFAFTGTSVTVKIQHSSDDGAGDPYADIAGATFTAATALGAERIATAAGLTIKRYTRVVTTGVFSNAQFAVNAVRNATAVVF